MSSETRLFFNGILLEAQYALRTCTFRQKRKMSYFENFLLKLERIRPARGL